MSWAGGIFTRLYGATGWDDDRQAGTAIESGRHDNHDQDLATGINACVNKAGSNSPTANLPMATYRHTGVGNASARTDYAAAGQVQDGALAWAGTSAGAADAQTLTMTPTLTAYPTGGHFAFKAGAGLTNTGACTINIDAIGAKDVKRQDGTDPVAGDITAGEIYKILYDGTNLVLLNPSWVGIETRIQSGAFIWGGTSAGTANAQTLTLSPAITAYVAGQTFRFLVGTSNTGATTLNVNAVGAKAIQVQGAACVGGELVANNIAEVVYDGTQFQLLSQPPLAYYSVMPNSLSNASAAEFDIWDEDNYSALSAFDIAGPIGITYTPADGKFTVTNAGLYAIHCHITAYAAATATAYQVSVDKNGVTQHNHSGYAMVTSINPTSFTTMLQLAAGDYINILVDSTTANTIIINDFTQLTIWKIV
jgi:hypothetical protein